MADTEQSLLDYLTTLDESGTLLTRDTALLDLGLLDLINLVQLIQFIEERFGIAVPDEDLRPETFNTVATLAAYVAARGGKAA